MVKKLTAVLLTMCMAVSLLPMFAQAASKPDIKVGDYVKMGTYNNASILWRCVSIDDTVRLCLQTELLTLLRMMPRQTTTAIRNRTAEAISAPITAQIIGETAICVPGSIQLRLQVRSIGFAVTRRRMVMSAEQGPIIIKRAF